MAMEQQNKWIRVFISYSRVDSEFAFRLRADLEASGFATWMDPNLGSEGGQNWERMIQEAIDSCQAMVVIVSPDSAKSEWVHTEYRYFLDHYGDQQKNPLIPAYFRTVDQFPIVLQIKQWIDFRQDQGSKDPYQDSLYRLILSLSKAPESPILQPIPNAPRASSPANTTPGSDKPVYPSVAPTPEFSPEIQGWIAGVFKARGEGNLTDEEYFLKRLVGSGNPQVPDTYQQRLKTVSDQTNQQRINELRKQAQVAVAAKQWRVAIGAWQAILALAPSNNPAKEGVRQARTEFAKEAFDAGEFDDAVGAWQALVKDARAIEARTGLRTALFARADDAWLKGDWTRAAESWEAIRTLPSTYENSKYNSDLRREKEADKYIDEIKKNQNAADRYLTAHRLLAVDNVPGARAALKDLYTVAPNYGDPAGIASRVAIYVPKTLVDHWIEKGPTLKADERAQKHLHAWLAPSFVIALFYCPLNYLAAAITSAIRAGDWWTGTMLANSFKLAWMSFLLSIGLLLLCGIIIRRFRSVLNAQRGALQFTVAMFFALMLAIPACWLVALWLFTGFQENMDSVTLGIIIGASAGGIITAFITFITFLVNAGDF